MDLLDFHDAWSNYLTRRAPIEDVQRINREAAALGVTLTDEQAIAVWEWFSETRYSAGWMVIGTGDVERALEAFIKDQY